MSFLLLNTIFQYLVAQTGTEKTELNGYLSGMPYYMWSKEDNFSQLQFHNRLNFTWYPTSNFTASVQFRNQLIYGDFVEMGNYKNGLVSENYFVPLTLQQKFGDKGLLSISADRLWGGYTKGNIDIKLGRQRINWGQTFAWNPNDIFNTYNFFDFDYAERPGADAVRIQYYTGSTSQLDIAAKVDSSSNITTAALFRFNQWNSDFQIIGGYYSQPYSDSANTDKSQSDFVAGLGFTTDMKGISLRSEMTYLNPTKESAYQHELFLMSIGLDYSFTNNLFFGVEFYYASRVNVPTSADFISFYSGPLTIKNLTFTRYNFFAQASYPVTPLINASLSGMLFTDDFLQGYYLGPTIDFSLLDNLGLSAVVQYFSFSVDNPMGGGSVTNNNTLGFLRLKWNF
jgi:hypothetical protein